MSEYTAGWRPGQGEAASSRPVRIGRGTVRGLAWFALVGQVVFVASWIVAGALEPGYSHAESGMGALGARGAEHPWIMLGGFAVLGLSIAALGPAVLAVLERRRATWVAAALFVVAGAAMAAEALLPLDCDFATAACQSRFEAGELSWQTSANLWAGLAFELAFVGTAFALWRALGPGPLAGGALVSGLAGVAIVAVAWGLHEGLGAGEGAVQRIGMLAVHNWVAIVAIGLLHRTAVPRASDLIPVGPRDFLGRSWSGPARFCPGPIWANWLAQPVTFRRESRWIADELWVMDDTAAFEGGSRIERRMFGQVVAPDRVRVVADDMPGGADLVLEDGGYRVFPYRYAFPLGPVRLTMRCRDEVEACDDGSLLWTIRFSWLGLRMGTLRGRVRRAEGAA